MRGRLNKHRERVTILELGKTPDGAGGYLVSSSGYQEVLSTWATISEGVRGNLALEKLEFGQTVSDKLVFVEMDYRDDLVSHGGTQATIQRETHALKWGEKIIDIQSVKNRDNLNWVYDIVGQMR